MRAKANFLKIFFALTLFLCSCSHNAIEITDEVTVFNPEFIEQQTIIFEPKVEVIQTVFYTIPEYYDGLYIAAEIQNTGNVAVKIDEWSSSFDIEDSDGTFVYHMKNLKGAPQLLLPGEIGYLVKLDLQLDIDLEKCKNVVVNLTYDIDYSSMLPVKISVEDNSISEFSGYFYATPGRLVNTFVYDLDATIPITAFYGNDHKFLGVSIDYPVEVPANGKIGFSGESASPIPLSAFSIDDIKEIVTFGSYNIKPE